MGSLSSEVGPTEDVVRALLEYLVDPMLPLKSSSHEAPSLSQQQSVAKQVHAVVLLYNYYQRKRQPEVEFLGFESFCKLAVTLRPTLIAYMKLMQRSDYTEVDDLENQLSLTENAIMDACNIALVLDASKDVLSTEGWPICKVAVLLIDSRKENCFLLFSSITHGVWSVIEKDFDVSNINSESSAEGKHMNKRKKISRKPLIDELGGDDIGLQQLAFSAIKEATGINQIDLMILESHVVYSLSKEKTAARFYIVQHIQSSNQDLQVPIKDAIESLQGPLVKKISRCWVVTPVIEYYHLLPYAGILSDWLSREVSSNNMQDVRVASRNMNVNSSERSENPCEKEVTESKEMSSSGLQDLSVELENINVNTPQRTEDFPDKEVTANMDKSDKNCNITDLCDNKVRSINISQRTEKACDNGTVEKIDKSVESPHRTENSRDKEVTENMDKSDKNCNSTDFGDNKASSISISRRTEKACDNVTVEKIDKSVNSPQRTENSCDKEVTENMDKSDKNCNITAFGDNKASGISISPWTEKACESGNVEIIDNSVKSCEIANYIGNDASGAYTESQKWKENDGCQIACLFNPSNAPQTMDIDDSPVVCRQNKDKNKNANRPVIVYHHQKKRTSTERDINASRIAVKHKAELTDSILKSQITECRSEKVDTGNKIFSTSSSDQDVMPIGDVALGPFQMNNKHLEKVQLVLASRETSLSQTALRALLKKREKLYHQVRFLEDEIAVCDKNINTIVNGGEDDLALKLEAIMDCCNDAFINCKSQNQERTYLNFEAQGSSLYMKGKRLSEAILTLRTPCQELDVICYENNWLLPTYRVSPSDGGFLANVNLKGVDFEYSGESNLQSSPHEARESAAEKMITKLRSVRGQLQ